MVTEFEIKEAMKDLNEAEQKSLLESYEMILSTKAYLEKAEGDEKKKFEEIYNSLSSLDIEMLVKMAKEKVKSDATIEIVQTKFKSFYENQ